MPSQSTNVFVSYSHADAALVAPVVKLLRVNKSLVFQDVDDIQPGKKWRSGIWKALAESHLVVVFWCSHASRSDEVSKEWKAAIEQAKDLLPLLLDETPLPPALSEFQWIDFPATVGANHRSIDSPATDVQVSAPSPRSRSAVFPTTVAVFVTAVALSLFALYGPGILLLLAAVIAAAAFLCWLLERRSKRRTRIEMPSEIERHIATELETEILRRIASSRQREA